MISKYRQKTENEKLENYNLTAEIILKIDIYI